MEIPKPIVQEVKSKNYEFSVEQQEYIVDQCTSKINQIVKQRLNKRE
jgi:hypothetical protein